MGEQWDSAGVRRRDLDVVSERAFRGDSEVAK